MNQLVLLEIDCDWTDQRCQQALQNLPPDVQARAARYRCPKARRNLVSTQSRLRSVLDRLGIEQENLLICPQGRPYIKDCPLEFNLSHSESQAVLALAWDENISNALGVDIEWMDRRVERAVLAERFFTEKEFHYTLASKENFFRIWTRKEAILKSNGVGLRVELNGFEVLEQDVSQEVTGRSLSLTTSVRENGYIISWAVPRDWILNKVTWVSSDSENWLESVAEGIGAPT